MEVFAGICPNTRKVVTVGMADPQSLRESLQDGQILVLCTAEQARELWGIKVDDVFDLPAAIAKATP